MAKMKKKYTIIAIDEAGRGPLAGPVSVAGVAFVLSKNRSFRHESLKGIRDSKKLSARQRDEWFIKLKNKFDYRVSMVGPQIIDRDGITKAVAVAIARILRRFDFKPGLVILDGTLHAPKHYNQLTIIKGDERIPLISAASIMAKVKRDRLMQKFDNIYPQYFLKKHKGYGTKLHYEMLKVHGISEIHRRTFLKNISCK